MNAVLPPLPSGQMLHTSPSPRWTGGVPDAAIAMTAALEEFSPKAYDDGYGFWTIGFGARTCPRGKPVTRRTPNCTRDEAEWMIRRDLAIACDAVAVAVSAPIDEAQAAALMMLSFNLGKLHVAAKSLVALVNAGKTVEAAERFQVYRMSAGKPSKGLRRRRWFEAAVFLGADPKPAKALAWATIHSADDWPPLPYPQGALSHV